MNEYEFTLKFSFYDNNINQDELVDKLYNSGCSDALIGLGKKGRIALEFIREANSASEAIFSAIKDVKKALPNAKLIETMPDFVGLTDIAELLEFSRQNMRKIMEKHNNDFPIPVHESSVSFWHLFDVLEWIKQKNLYKIKNSLIETSKINMAINTNINTPQFDFPIPQEISLLLK